MALNAMNIGNRLHSLGKHFLHLAWHRVNWYWPILARVHLNTNLVERRIILWAVHCPFKY